MKESQIVERKQSWRDEYGVSGLMMTFQVNQQHLLKALGEQESKFWRSAKVKSCNSDRRAGVDAAGHANVSNTIFHIYANIRA
jgi:hypothetical protein